MEDGIKRLFAYLIAGGGSGSGGGSDGREIELRNNGEYIQWRYSGEEDWTNLVALADLKGEKGDNYILTEEDIEEIASKVKVATSADKITYDDTETQLGADDVQGAIGKLSEQNVDRGTSLWAIVKKTAFAEALTDAELTAFKTAWGITDSGEDTEVTLSSISATYSGGSVLVGTSVNALTGIVVTAKYSDGSTKTVTGYTLSGTIAEGSNTVTISYGGKSTTITVIGYAENEEEITLTSISATYTGGEVTVGTALTDLIGITVTGTYSDGSTSTITGYTLSGEIVEGENTITASYGGKTTTFTVTGIVESGGEEEPDNPETGVSNETTWTDGVDYTYEGIDGEYVETTGIITPYTGWSRTPYLYCRGASKLRVTVAVQSSQLQNLGIYNAFYDENKNFLQMMSSSSILGEVGTYLEIDIPTDAVYFIMSNKKNVVNGNPSYAKFTPYE